MFKDMQILGKQIKEPEPAFRTCQICNRNISNFHTHIKEDEHLKNMTGFKELYNFIDEISEDLNLEFDEERAMRKR